MNVVNVYAPHSGLDEEVKTHLLEELDMISGGMLIIEKIYIGRDFNGHIGTTPSNFDDVHGFNGFGVRNCG